MVNMDIITVGWITQYMQLILTASIHNLYIFKILFFYIFKFHFLNLSFITDIYFFC